MVGLNERLSRSRISAYYVNEFAVFTKSLSGTGKRNTGGGLTGLRRPPSDRGGGVMARAEEKPPRKPQEPGDVLALAILTLTLWRPHAALARRPGAGRGQPGEPASLANVGRIVGWRAGDSGRPCLSSTCSGGSSLCSYHPR
jgi:hypothetical protein